MSPPWPRAAVWRWLGFAICLGVLAAALIPGGGKPPFPGFDKLVHGAVFACLGGWFGALAIGRARVLSAGLALVAFGALIEVLQSFTGRDPSWRDLGADIVGVAVGLLLLRTLTAHVLGYIEGRVAKLS